MKKALSVILSVLVIFSMFGMVVSAADLVSVKFEVDGTVVYQLDVLPGESFVNRLLAEDTKLKTPERAPTETTEYIFKNWRNKATGEVTFTGNVPAVSQADYDNGVREVVYVAEFAEKEIKQNQSFWAFVQSIFERINWIFEYFAKVFEGVIDF